MSKKISITLSGNRFDIDLEEEFADFLKSALAEDLSTDANNDPKKVLQAYVKKCHELFELENSIETLSKQITTNLQL